VPAVRAQWPGLSTSADHAADLVDADLTAAIEASSGESPVNTVLRTDQRVLARVTDGIYRQPGSALRELLSNAYDADATRVVVKTDRPRFSTISIEDDGLGMSPATLARLVHHIGGSAKRTTEGANLGLASSDDPTRSPAGRKLIGRIGIGLFSVAQLTDRFQIITKVAGDPHRTVATVVLRQFADDDASDVGDEGMYEAGKVNIWREPATDAPAQGTTIVLTDIRLPTRDTLRSRDLWVGVDADKDLDPDVARGLNPPRFHIGRVDPDNPDFVRGGPSAVDDIPWTSADPPEEAFRKLVDAVWDVAEEGGVANAQLWRIFDYYLQMAWLQIGLAVPSKYVDGHPFDIPFGDSLYLYDLPQDSKASPKELHLAGGQTIRDALSLGPGSTEGDDFEVILDDLKISRPLRFRGLPTTGHQVKKPMLFVGRCREEFPGVSPELSGGPIEFDAYLMWAPKIVPTEHQGALIRIHGSSGTAFDPTFMRYQISEQTRLRQTTCEIFVRTGLEGALNIDRESFNYAHPHVVYLTRWLHLSLRRLATVQKRVAGELRAESRQRGEEATQERLETIVSTAWEREADDVGQAPPPVQFVSEPDEETAREDREPAARGGYRLRRTAVFGETSNRPTVDRRVRGVERKLRAVIQLLAAYRLLDDLSNGEQERLAGYLREILEAEDE